MKICVIGCGSIGSRHARNVLSLGHELGIMDVNATALYALRGALGGYIATPDSLDGYDAVIVCTPHSSHVDWCSRALTSGCHVLVEKPISNSVKSAMRLRHLVERSDRTLQVAYNMRHHPVMLEAARHISSLGRVYAARFEFGSRLDSWRSTDYRQNYAASFDDGGILLDDVHEIDMACRLLAGRPTSVSCVTSRTGDIEIMHETSAELLVCMDVEGSEVPVSIHMDYLRRPAARQFTLLGTSGTVTGDVLGCKLSMHTASGASTLTSFDNFEANSMYLSELSDFVIACSEGRSRGVEGVDDGIIALAVAEAARKSAETGTWVSL